MKKAMLVLAILSVMAGCANHTAQKSAEGLSAGYIDSIAVESTTQEVIVDTNGLYAEWLYENGRYDEIVFRLNNGNICEYRNYAEGEMFAIDENNVLSWYPTQRGADYSHEAFINFLEIVLDRYDATIEPQPQDDELKEALEQL